MKELYYCDPNKNTKCPKITGNINGNDYGCFKTCFFTTDPEVKADDDSIKPEQALAALEFVNYVNRQEDDRR